MLSPEACTCPVGATQGSTGQAVRPCFRIVIGGAYREELGQLPKLTPLFHPVKTSEAKGLLICSSHCPHDWEEAWEYGRPLSAPRQESARVGGALTESQSGPRGFPRVQLRGHVRDT